uniref:Golgi associated RAB2 interactor 5A n=1 Tax=Mus spicilegus TaxID=10103 RepID=A0A8C6GV99_MUSSI
MKGGRDLKAAPGGAGCFPCNLCSCLCMMRAASSSRSSSELAAPSTCNCALLQRPATASLAAGCGCSTACDSTRPPAQCPSRTRTLRLRRRRRRKSRRGSCNPRSFKPQRPDSTHRSQNSGGSDSDKILPDRQRTRNQVSSAQSQRDGILSLIKIRLLKPTLKPWFFM